MLRVLVHPAADAAWNMAVDEALLLTAAVPTLRLYGWAPHAVSLGYFQAYRDFVDLADSAPLVRRLTGGGAIHHGDELTFSLALAAARLGTVSDSYRTLHDAIVRALDGVGVTSRRLAGRPTPAARPTTRWCFAAPGCFDIVTERGKLLGSAQRRLGPPNERVLHHGSLVMQPPAFTPAVAAIADCPHPPSPAALREGIIAEVASSLGLAAVPGTLTATEQRLAERLVVERYATAQWNQRR